MEIMKYIAEMKNALYLIPALAILNNLSAVMS